MSHEFLVGSHKVRITDVHCTQTYGGVLEYSDVGRINKRLIRRAREQMEPLWGRRPMILLDPYSESPRLLLTFTDQMRIKRLPRWLIFAWLLSDWCRDPDEYGTQLFVGMFAGEVFLEPISQVIARRVSRLVWEDFAQDYAP